MSAHWRWNYKVVRYVEGDEEQYTIHEVYYSPDGNIQFWSEPIPPGGYSMEELAEDLQRMLLALDSDVIEWSELESKELH